MDRKDIVNLTSIEDGLKEGYSVEEVAKHFDVPLAVVEGVLNLIKKDKEKDMGKELSYGDMVKLQRLALGLTGCYLMLKNRNGRLNKSVTMGKMIYNRPMVIYSGYKIVEPIILDIVQNVFKQNIIDRSIGNMYNIDMIKWREALDKNSNMKDRLETVYLSLFGDYSEENSEAVELFSFRRLLSSDSEELEFLIKYGVEKLVVIPFIGIDELENTIDSFKKGKALNLEEYGIESLEELDGIIERYKYTACI